MKTVELNMRLPYNGRGRILSRLYREVGGRVQEAHLLPPDLMGLSEIKLKVTGDDAAKLAYELKKTLKNGKVDFRVLSS